MTLRSALVVSLLVVLGLAGAAHAGDNALILVEKVDEAEEPAIQLAKATARRELELKAWALTEAYDAKLTPAQGAAIAACMRAGNAQCVERGLQAATVTHVFLLRVKANGPINGINTYELEALLTPRSGRPVRAAKRYCESCSAASLENMSVELTNDVLAQSAGAGTLDLKSDPAGATVYLDGEPVGITPLTLAAQAGDHVISFSKTGYAPVADVKVAVQAGNVSPVSRTLVPIEGPGGDDHLKPALAVPISLMAIGVGALGVGVYFIATGGEASEGGKQPKTLMRTPGFIIAGSGALVAGIGTFLLVRELGKAKREAPVSIDAGVAPGFVFVGARVRY